MSDDIRRFSSGLAAKTTPTGATTHYAQLGWLKVASPASTTSPPTGPAASHARSGLASLETELRYRQLLINSVILSPCHLVGQIVSFTPSPFPMTTNNSIKAHPCIGTILLFKVTKVTVRKGSDCNCSGCCARSPSRHKLTAR
jgi:hypothetical protein